MTTSKGDDRKEKLRQKKLGEYQKIDFLINKAIPQKISAPSTMKDLQIGFFRLFRFATSEDRVMMIFGSLAALINGACLPMFGILYGEVRDALVEAVQSSKSPGNSISDISGYFLIIGGVCFFTGFIQQYCWNVAGTQQSITIRKQYYSALFRQDMTWFQKEDKLMLVNKIQNELFGITDGIADKVGFFLMAISIGISSLLQSFFSNVQMTLILVVTIPILAYPFYYYERTSRLIEKLKQEESSQAGKIFDQTVQQIKSVKSFNKEDIIYQQYVDHIKSAKIRSISYGLKLGLSLGLTVLALFYQNGIILYIGSIMVEKKMRNSIAERSTNLSDVVVVFVSLLICGIVLGQINPFINMIARARQAGGRVFNTIDAMHTINPQEKYGKEIPELKGNIRFENVNFKYRINNQTYDCLENLSLEIGAGQKVSIIGQSGSGKSSLVNLILRFYDPDQGSIYVDGENIKDFNVNWWRQQIGYLGQEPEVFYGSIKDNLLISKEDATIEEINDVLEQVNLLKTISNFEKNINSNVKNLSVGERQRLCLARILLRKPKIYIFDEPTSSQDFRMERSIQQLIDRITKNSTAIIISHSFSNIQQSDQIVIMSKGKIIKKGTHTELIQEDGIYLNIIEEHQYIDEGMQFFIKKKIQEEEMKCEAGENDDLMRSQIDDSRLDQSIKPNSLQQIELSKKQSEINRKLEKQKQKLEELKKKIKEKMDQRFLNLDFGYQNQQLLPEQFIFNFGSYKKTKEQFFNHQKKHIRGSISQVINQKSDYLQNAKTVKSDYRASLYKDSEESDQPFQKKNNLDQQGKLIELIDTPFKVERDIKKSNTVQLSGNHYNFNNNNESSNGRNEIKEIGKDHEQQQQSNRNQHNKNNNILESCPSQVMNSNLRDEMDAQTYTKDAAFINYQNEVYYSNYQTYKFILQEKEALKGLLWQLLGMLMAIVHGAIYPVNSIVIADTILSISNYTMNPTTSNKTKIGLSIINFFYTGIVGFISAIIMTYSFNVAGEILQFNLQRLIFKKTLHLPMQWFLKKSNKLGILSEMANVDTQKLSSWLSQKLSYQLQNVSSIITAMIVSYYFNYRLAIIITVMFPIVIVASIFIRRNSYSQNYEKELTDHKANQFITDAILNYKAIASMVFAHNFLEEQFSLLYQQQIQNLKLKAKKQAFLYGLAMFIIVSSQSWFFFVVSKIDFNKYNIRDLFVCILSILYAIFSIMENLRYLSDIGNALSARKRIYQHLFKHKSEDQIHSEVQEAYEKKNKQKMDGTLQNLNVLPIQVEIQNQSKLYKIGTGDSTKNSNLKSQSGQETALKPKQLMLSMNNSLQDQQQSKAPEAGGFCINRMNNNDIFSINTNNNNNNMQLEEEVPLLEFKQVYFKYPHRENFSLYNINFKLQRGDKVSIIGASGSGKSTIFSLLLGFYENYQGQILINGKDIRSMSLLEIRRECRWVQQDPFILQESLQENIIFGSTSKNFNFKRYKQSIAVACGEDILLKMKDQYLNEQALFKQKQLMEASFNQYQRAAGGDLVSGKRSSRLTEYGFLNAADQKKRNQDDFIKTAMQYKLQELSGGQRQKICLARAIYSTGTIYLFDNATSQLDIKTEKQVFKNLKTNYFKAKTFLQISHRLEPILYSDKLMIINSGRLIEFKNVEKIPKNKLEDKTKKKLIL